MLRFAPDTSYHQFGRKSPAQAKPPPFTLYEYRPSPFCVAVRLALEECEVHFTAREVDLKKPRTAAFLKRSPFGRLPALVEHRPGGELAIFESTAILLFLSDRFPDSSLSFDDMASKAEATSWLNFIANSFSQVLGIVCWRRPFTRKNRRVWPTCNVIVLH